MPGDNSLLLKTLSSFHVKRYKKGNIVLYQGEVPQATYVIRSGVVKVYSINTQGEERTVVFYIAGDIFPTTNVSLQRAATATYYYEAVTDIEIYAVPSNEFRQLVSRDPQLALYIADYYISQYMDAMMRINALEQAKASEKVMYTLFYLLQSCSEEIHEGLYKIKINLTQAMLASLIGLTRETTANELLRLKKQGVLSYRSQRYMIHKDKLINLIGEENFKDY